MKRLMEYIYYRLFSWNLRIHGKEDCPQWNSVLGISFLLWMNILTVINFYSALFPDNDIESFLSSNYKYKIVAVFALMCVVNYCWLVKGMKYNVLAEKFEAVDKDKKQRKKGNWQIVIYLAASVGLFIVSAFARR